MSEEMEKGTLRTASRKVCSYLKMGKKRDDFELVLANLNSGVVDLESKFAVHFPKDFERSFGSVSSKVKSEAKREGINLSLTIAFKVHRL